VGIGTSSPDANSQLHVKKTGANAKITLECEESYDAYINFSGATSEMSLGYDATDNAFIIANAADGLTSNERMRIDSSGNVGIGTSSPAELLDVNNTSNSHRVAIFRQNNASYNTDIALYHTSSSSDSTLITKRTNGDLWLYQSTAKNIAFFTTSSERMRIDASGNVGIGTDSPTAKLEVSEGGSTAAQGDTDLLVRHSSAAGTTAQVQILAGNTGYSNLYLSDTDAYNAGGFIYNHSSNYLATNVNGAERMRIDSSGNLHVGKTATSNTTAGTSLLEDGRFTFIVDQGDGGQEVGVINNQTSGTYVIDFRQANTDVGRIRVTASATEYQTSSDYRLKENVEYDWDATTRLNELKPARFSWIANPDVGTVDGFLAHEVSDIVPESIGGEKDEVDSDGNPVYQGIDQSKLVPLLTKALQEAHAKIQIQENQINDLTARIEALENA
jgi:hypothetical protein